MDTIKGHDGKARVGYRADLESQANALLAESGFNPRNVEQTEDAERMTLDYSASFEHLALYSTGASVADMIQTADAHDFERMRETYAYAGSPKAARRAHFGYLWERTSLSGGHRQSSEVTVYDTDGNVIDVTAARTVSRRGRVGEGKTRKHTDNAAKQAAYRERKKQAKAREDERKRAELVGQPALSLK